MTRGPLIHGALLVAALAFAYQTWTRDDTASVDRGEFKLWDQSPEAFKSLTFKADKKTVRFERRSDDGRTYLWATVTRETERPKPKPPAEPATDGANDEEGADSATPAGQDEPAEPDDKAKADDKAKPGDEAKAGTDDENAASAPGDADEAASENEPEAVPEDDKAEPEMIVETEVEEFPAGKTAQELIKAVAPLMALRDLGTPAGKELDTFGLADPTMVLTVEFKNATLSLQIGGRVYGGSDRYVRDPDSGRTYVIDGTEFRVLEGGDSALRDNRLIPAERDDVAGATVIAGEARRDVVRVSVPATAQGRAKVFWAASGKPDQEDATLTNFMSRVERLVPLGFEADLDASSLVEVAKFEYRNEAGDPIDTVVLLRGPGESDDKPEYYARSAHTRIHARLNRPLSAQIEEDLAQIAEPTAEPTAKPTE